MYTIGITGLVASGTGKSTIAADMAKKLNCSVVSTDGFLYPNSELGFAGQKRGF